MKKVFVRNFSLALLKSDVAGMWGVHLVIETVCRYIRRDILFPQK